VKIEVHVYLHDGAEKEPALLRTLLEKVNLIMTDLTELKAAVARDAEVESSAITLLQGLKEKLDAAMTDPVALKALSDQLGASTGALAAAILANTPSDPAAPPADPAAP
jgi:hypothetical protein